MDSEKLSVQVRISGKLHRALKTYSASKGKTMTYFLNDLVRKMLKEHQALPPKE